MAERRSGRSRELRQAESPFSFFSLAINSQYAKIKAELKRIIRKIQPFWVYRRTIRITKRFSKLPADVRQRTSLVLCTSLYALCTRCCCRYYALPSQMYASTPNSSIKGNSLKPSDALSIFVNVVGIYDVVLVGV